MLVEEMHHMGQAEQQEEDRELVKQQQPRVVESRTWTLRPTLD